VPEPATIFLFTSGLLGLVISRKKSSSLYSKGVYANGN